MTIEVIMFSRKSNAFCLMPKGNNASLIPISKSINDMGLLVLLTIKSSSFVFVFRVNLRIILVEIKTTSSERMKNTIKITTE